MILYSPYRKVVEKRGLLPHSKYRMFIQYKMTGYGCSVVQ